MSEGQPAAAAGSDAPPPSETTGFHAFAPNPDKQAALRRAHELDAHAAARAEQLRAERLAPRYIAAPPQRLGDGPTVEDAAAVAAHRAERLGKKTVNPKLQRLIQQQQAVERRREEQERETVAIRQRAHEQAERNRVIAAAAAPAEEASRRAMRQHAEEAAMQRAAVMPPPAVTLAPPAAMPTKGYEEDGEWIPGCAAAAGVGDEDEQFQLALALSLDENAAAEAADPTPPLPKAAPASLPSSVLDSITCPIGQCVMSDPVVTASGQTYDREHIEGWFRHCAQRGLPLTDPLSNAPLTSNALVSNIAIRRLVHDYHRDAEGCSPVYSTSDAPPRTSVPPSMPPPSMPPPPPAPSSGGEGAPVPLASALAQLRSMGFADEATNRDVLDAAGGDLERALEMLLT